MPENRAQVCTSEVGLPAARGRSITNAVGSLIRRPSSRAYGIVDRSARSRRRTKHRYVVSCTGCGRTMLLDRDGALGCVYKNAHGEAAYLNEIHYVPDARFMDRVELPSGVRQFETCQTGRVDLALSFVSKVSEDCGAAVQIRGERLPIAADGFHASCQWPSAAYGANVHRVRILGRLKRAISGGGFRSAIQPASPAFDSSVGRYPFPDHAKRAVVVARTRVH